MAGIIAGAMAGGGTAMQTLATQGAGYLASSQLQSEAAAIQEARDQRLAEIRKGEMEYGEELRRKPGKEAAAKIEKAKGEFVDDPSGTVRQRTRSEMAEVEEGAYREQGLVSEAMQTRQTEMQRERDNQTTLDRTRDNERADRQLELTAQNFDVTAKGAKLDQQIKQITLDNAKRVEELRKEFETATPARKNQITETVQLLTGKDADKFLPVPLKDEMGNITGYRVLNTRTGEWVDEKPGGPALTGAKWDNSSGDVMLDGKKIGTATTREEATALVAKARGGNKKPEPPGAAIVKPQPARSPGLGEVLDQQRPRSRKPVADIDEDDRMPFP